MTTMRRRGRDHLASEFELAHPVARADLLPLGDGMHPGLQRAVPAHHHHIGQILFLEKGEQLLIEEAAIGTRATNRPA